MSSSAIGPDGKVHCKHMEEAAKRKSKTPKHPNRDFYCCKRPQSDPTRCGFFAWADELLPGNDIDHIPSSSAVSPAARPRSNEGAGFSLRAPPPSTPHIRPPRDRLATPSETPRSRKRLEDIQAGLRQRDVDLSPTRHPGPSKESKPKPSTSIPDSPSQVIPQPPSPVPTEVDEVEEQPPPPRKTASFLGLPDSPQVIATTIKDEGQPSTPKKRRVSPPEDVVIPPPTGAGPSGGGLLLTPPQTTRRGAGSDEPELVSAVFRSRKGKGRENRPPVETRDQDGRAQYDPFEGEPQEDFLPLFTLPEDASTVASISPTIAENVLDYTDGVKARAKALTEYMDSYDISQAARLLQIVERQKLQYEYRDRCQKKRIEELVAENDILVSEVARLEEALQRSEESNRVKDEEMARMGL